jgi:hypothetical protein
MKESTKLVEVYFPNGKSALIETRLLDDSVDNQPEDADVSFKERDVLLKQFSFSHIEDSIQTVSNSVLNALKKISPSKVSVELGFEVGVKEGELTALLVKGEGKTSIKVTLEWEAQK